MLLAAVCQGEGLPWALLGLCFPIRVWGPCPSSPHSQDCCAHQMLISYYWKTGISLSA